MLLVVFIEPWAPKYTVICCVKLILTTVNSSNRELEAVYNPQRNLRLSAAAWCASTVRGYVIAFHSPMNWTFSFAITQTVADGKWSHQHATPITPELSWCILRRGVAIIGPNGNRCCVPWDMASLAQHAGCQALGAPETSCCFSSPHSLHIRNNLSGTMS